MAVNSASFAQGEAWFELLREAEALKFKQEDGQVVRNPAQLRAKLELRGDRLHSLVNGASYGAGIFSTPTLAELRQATASLAGGELMLEHLATGDIFELHSRPEYRGAMFMAASQFNCLEFPHADVVPEDGVTNYVYDGTQGPACALAAPAAAVARHYHVARPNGEVGQTEKSQLNLLGDLLSLVQGSSGDSWVDGGAANAAGVDPVSVRNGYTSSDERRLGAFNRRLQALAVPHDELLGALRIGLHSGVEVPWGPQRFELLPPQHRQTVTQAFCSALAIGYSDGSAASWAPLARMVLDAAYEATLLAAALEQSQGRGTGVVLLTRLGGGVFGNDPSWIDAAIARACVRASHLPLRVVLCHYRAIDEGAKQRIEAAVEAERERRQAPTLQSEL